MRAQLDIEEVTVIDTEGLSGDVLTLVVADQHPGNKPFQRLSVTLYLLGFVVLLSGTPATGFVLLFSDTELWYGKAHPPWESKIWRARARRGP